MQYNALCIECKLQIKFRKKIEYVILEFKIHWLNTQQPKNIRHLGSSDKGTEVSHPPRAEKGLRKVFFSSSSFPLATESKMAT